MSLIDWLTRSTNVKSEVYKNYYTLNKLAPDLALNLPSEIINYMKILNQQSILIFQNNREHHYSGILVDFAIQLMTLLENINRDSFQRFQLRAGLNQVWGPSELFLLYFVSICWVLLGKKSYKFMNLSSNSFGIFLYTYTSLRLMCDLIVKEVENDNPSIFSDQTQQNILKSSESL